MDWRAVLLHYFIHLLFDLVKVKVAVKSGAHGRISTLVDTVFFLLTFFRELSSDMSFCYGVNITLNFHFVELHCVRIRHWDLTETVIFSVFKREFSQLFLFSFIHPFEIANAFPSFALSGNFAFAPCCEVDIALLDFSLNFGHILLLS